MKDAVAAPDADMAIEHHVGADPGAVADLGVRADDAVGPDAHALAEPRAAVDDRAGVDLRRHFSSIDCIEQRIVASATTSPPTRATQLNLLMPRSCRS